MARHATRRGSSLPPPRSLRLFALPALLQRLARGVTGPRRRGALAVRLLHAWEEVDAGELSALLAASEPGWRRRACAPDPAQLEKAMQHSTAVCAAYARVADIRTFRETHGQGGGSDDAVVERWLDGTGTLSGLDAKRRGDLRLVAFARVISDEALVGIFHDTAIAAPVSQSEVGREVVSSLVRVLADDYDIADIGVAMSPAHGDLQHAFNMSNFGPDEEETLVMRYPAP